MSDAFVAGAWGGVRGSRHRKSRIGGGWKLGREVEGSGVELKERGRRDTMLEFSPVSRLDYRRFTLGSDLSALFSIFGREDGVVQ